MSKTPQHSSRPTKETFHVLIDGDGRNVFANATANIGGRWPFQKPQLTCAVRVSSETVAFSVLRPTKNTRSKLLAKPMSFPRGPLARLERRARTINMVDDADVIVEITTPLPADDGEDAVGGDRAVTHNVSPTADTDPTVVSNVVVEATGFGLDDLFPTPAATSLDGQNPVAETAALDDPPAALLATTDTATTDTATITGDDHVVAGGDDPTISSPTEDDRFGEVTKVGDETSIDTTTSTTTTSTDALDDAVVAPVASSNNPPPSAADGVIESPPQRRQRPTRIDTYVCSMRVDESGIAHIEQHGDDHHFELPRRAVNAAVYLRGVRGRKLAIGWIGYVGKSGTTETVARVASMVVNAISLLPEFRILSGIDHIQLPAAPAATYTPITRRRSFADIEFDVGVELVDSQLSPVAAGTIGVRIDLENANPSSGRLLLHYQPDDRIVEHFDAYRSSVDSAFAALITDQLGEAVVCELVYDIVLGSIDDRSVQKLRDVVAEISALQITPTTFHTT